MFVSASHELSEEYREFERCSTVVANAYVGPIVRRYIGEIDDHIRSEGFGGSFLIVQSTGGLYEAEQAKNHCVRMLESGPAAGVIGTQALCRTLGLKNAIAFDMGGTTAKAGVIYNGEALTTGAALIGGYDKALPVQIAMMDIFEVGTGGGSIARVEEGGLRVGPQSAGAAPGPACYGLGGTRADRDRRQSRARPARRRPLPRRRDEARHRGGQARARRAGGEAARHGRDARRRTAFCASPPPRCPMRSRASPPSAGSMPATLRWWPMAAPGRCTRSRSRARSASARVIVPTAPGVFSAFGMLFSDLRYDFVRTWFTRLEDAPFDEIERVYRELESQGRDAIAGSSVKPQKIVVKRAADMRYVGQEHAVTVDLPLERVRAAGPRGDQAPFRRHARAALRHVGAGRARRDRQPAHHRHRRHAQAAAGEDRARQDARRDKAAFTGKRPVFVDGKFRPTPTYARAALAAGNRIAGPALIEEHASTTVLLPGDRLEVDAHGNLVIKVAGGR